MADDPPETEIPAPKLDAEWETDTLSKIEEQQWPGYDAVSEQKKANRLAIHKTFGIIIPAAILVAFVLFIVVLAIYVAHLVMPLCWRWLSPDELQSIHDILFSSVVGGAIAIAARTYFFDDKKSKD